jgi:hypothetical protein
VNGPQPATIELHCVCGERRVVPAGLPVVSCIKCGQALGPPLPAPRPRPAIFLLAVAASSTQLVSGIALGLGITWVAKHFDARTELVAWLIVSILGILAGGKAYRGSVGALYVAAAVDVALVAVRLMSRDPLTEMLRVSGVVPYVTASAELLALSIAAFASFACVACLVAVPQARRYAAWQRRQIELAFRTRRL